MVNPFGVGGRLSFACRRLLLPLALQAIESIGTETSGYTVMKYSE